MVCRKGSCLALAPRWSCSANPYVVVRTTQNDGMQSIGLFSLALLRQITLCVKMGRLQTDGAFCNSRPAKKPRRRKMAAHRKERLPVTRVN